MSLAKSFFETHLGKSIDDTPLQFLSGMEVIEILQPLNDVFRPHIERIKTIRYRARCESGADLAIEALAQNPSANTWDELSPCVWRVLLERHQQILTVAATNHLQGNSRFSFVPVGLPAEIVFSGLLLFWLHSMELPFPVKDRAMLELPLSAPEGSFLLQ